MIKRRFYKIDHGDRDDDSEPSSSSSDSELEAEDIDESEDDAVTKTKDDDKSGSISSGYKSEDDSASDIDVNSSGLVLSEDDTEIGNEKEILIDRELSSKHDSGVLENVKDEKELTDMPSYVLKCKSVFKCRICPRVICLTEDTLRAHLKSKGHARSEKQLNEGRLKAMLNSDGEIETQDVPEINTKSIEDNTEKKHKGQKQRKKRLRKKKRGDDTNTRETKSTKGTAKRRRKNEN